MCRASTDDHAVNVLHGRCGFEEIICLLNFETDDFRDGFDNAVYFGGIDIFNLLAVLQGFGLIIVDVEFLL